MINTKNASEQIISLVTYMITSSGSTILFSFLLCVYFYDMESLDRFSIPFQKKTCISLKLIFVLKTEIFTPFFKTDLKCLHYLELCIILWKLVVSESNYKIALLILSFSEKNYIYFSIENSAKLKNKVVLNLWPSVYMNCGSIHIKIPIHILALVVSIYLETTLYIS